MDKKKLMDLSSRDLESSIDLGTFDPMAVAKIEEEVVTPPDPTPQIEELAQQVRDLTQKLAEQPTVTTPDAAPTPTAPVFTPATDDELTEMFSDGRTQEGVIAMQKKFAYENFMPALKVMADQFTSNQKTLETDNEEAKKREAAGAISRAVNAYPELVAIKDDIFEAFQGADPQAVLAEGVIENVINGVIGRKAREGTWHGGTSVPVTVPAGSAGPQESEEVSPAMKEVFRLITGVANADDALINTLKKPTSINLGMGEG